MKQHHTSSARQLGLGKIKVLLVVLVVAIVGASVYSYTQYFSPEQRFYSALEHRMDTAYMVQDYSSEVSGIGQSLNTQATTDFSNPSKPKSQLTYTFKQGSMETPSGDIGGEIVVAEDPSAFYGKLTLAPLLADNRIKLNTWYEVTRDNDYAPGVLDARNLRAAINSPLGVIIDGKFEEKDRTELMKYIKTEKVYDITSSRSEALDGKQTTAYTVALSPEKINALNKKVAKIIGVKGGTTILEPDAKATMTVWVTDVDSTIAKIQVKAELTNEGLEVDNQILYTYPQTASVTKPADS